MSKRYVVIQATYMVAVDLEPPLILLGNHHGDPQTAAMQQAVDRASAHFGSAVPDPGLKNVKRLGWNAMLVPEEEHPAMAAQIPDLPELADMPDLADMARG